MLVGYMVLVAFEVTPHRLLAFVPMFSLNKWLGQTSSVLNRRQAHRMAL